MAGTQPFQVRTADLRERFRPQREWAEGRGVFLIIGHFLVGIAGGAWVYGQAFGVPACLFHEMTVASVQVAHGRHEGERRVRSRPTKLCNFADDDHPRLKYSRRLFMARMRDTSRSKSASRSTKFRFSELTISTGAAA